MFPAFKMFAVFGLLGSVASILGVPISMLTGDIAPLYRVAMRILRLGVRAAGIQVQVTGVQNVPIGRPAIFMVNHVSNLDPPVLLPNLPGRSSVLLKKKITDIPMFGRALLMAQFVPVDRSNSREAAQRSVAAAAEALRSGLNILVFPEGTRSPTGRLSNFKKGPFFLARETSAPIVPIAVSGTETMMRKGSLAIQPGVARIQILPAIEPSLYATREDLMAAVHRSIAAALPTAMQPLQSIPKSAPTTPTPQPTSGSR